MIRDMISSAGTVFWPVAALILFVLLFAGIVLWTYSGRRDRFHYMRMLPLQGDANPEVADLRIAIPNSTQSEAAHDR